MIDIEVGEYLLIQVPSHLWGGQTMRARQKFTNPCPLFFFFAMSYGRPPNVESSPGKAPLLGSFPLDHDGT